MPCCVGESANRKVMALPLRVDTSRRLGRVPPQVHLRRPALAMVDAPPVWPRTVAAPYARDPRPDEFDDSRAGATLPLLRGCWRIAGAALPLHIDTPSAGAARDKTEGNKEMLQNEILNLETALNDAQESDKTEDDKKVLQNESLKLETATDAAKETITTFKAKIEVLGDGIRALDKEVADDIEQREKEPAEYTENLASDNAAVDLLKFVTHSLNKFDEQEPKLHRPLCGCRCTCRHRPGRLVLCIYCGAGVGPGCCLAAEFLKYRGYGICHLCHGRPQWQELRQRDPSETFVEKEAPRDDVPELISPSWLL